MRGFLVQWVWEPVEDIAKTLRSGGEGLGVAPTTVKSDQESLERMVLDLGRDYYGLKGEQLEVLGGKVRAGDMEEVLRVYEREMQVSLIFSLWYGTVGGRNIGRVIRSCDRRQIGRR